MDLPPPRPGEQTRGTYPHQAYRPSSRRSTESGGVASGGRANRVTAVPVVIASAK
jgi:hypothetical protein